jgi:hypothetical protein
MGQTVLTSGRTLTHHDPDVCNGEPCPLHNPTDHRFRQYPLDWKEEWGIMVRVMKDGQTIPDPDDYHVRQGGYILVNSFYCEDCEQTITSKHRHDFAECECGNFTDGGHDYIRRGGRLRRMHDQSITLGEPGSIF